MDDEDFPLGVAAIHTHQNLDKEVVGQRQLHYLPCYREVNGDPNANPGPGIAFFLEDGSVLLEASAVEYHGATRVARPNFYDPLRLATVCFCALVCDLPDHGHGTGARDEAWKERHHKGPVSFLF